MKFLEYHSYEPTTEPTKWINKMDQNKLFFIGRTT
jgi:hypothetical protein